MKKIIPVTKVGFPGRTGDNRTPESFPLPACMASLLEALEGKQPTICVKAHNGDYTKRPANDGVLAASGMAFALLWEPTRCFSSLDVTQALPGNEAVRRGFAWLGYDVTILEGDALKDARARVVASIDAGVPVLAFGVTDPPECALICGYDEDGAVVFGTSHFQDDSGLPADGETGYFRADHWEQDVWTIAIPGAKLDAVTPVRDVIASALDVLATEKIEGYLAGQAAYDAWAADLEHVNGSDDAACAACFPFHNALLFSLAELRCWGSNYLRGQGIIEAADCFQQIHDLCWQVSGALPNPAAYADSGARESAISIIRKMAALDKQAASAMRAWLNA